MRKLLTVLFSVAVLTFVGCGKSANAQASNEPASEAKIPTYFQGAYIDADTAAKTLEEAGFEIVANYKSIKDAKTIVFTCPTLMAEAAKPGRAYIAVMRMFVDEKEQAISITNPVYWGKGFMQDDFDYAKFAAVSSKINSAFPGLKDSVDIMDYEDLSGFHFMMSMPYYEDQEVVAEASDEKLLATAKNFKKGKGLIFELKVSETSTLLGYALGRGTTRFPKKIGRNNAGLLPWTISIEDGKAKILRGEYYIAMSYPLLDMGGFMGIMDIPDAVIKDMTKPFKRMK